MSGDNQSDNAALRSLAGEVPSIEPERLKQEPLKALAEFSVDQIFLPVIDISIVTYKSRRWFDEFFASLTAQHYPLDKINLYVTDHSPDDSDIEPLVHILTPLQTRLKSCSVEHRENRGFGAGHNRAVRDGKSDFLLVTNIDLTFEFDTLTRLMYRALTGVKDFVAWECRQKPYEHPKAYDILTQETSWVSGACLLFLRKPLEDVKGFDETFFMYGEDVDLSWRLRAKGGKLRYCPDSVVWHHTYKAAGDVKETQYFGGTLGNMYLRLRFGSLWAILVGFAMQAALLVHHQRFPEKHAKLWQNYRRIFRAMPHFLMSRPRRRSRFRIALWDYGRARVGAFVPSGRVPKKPPLVSIIVRTYPGRLPLLREALRSLELQTYRPLEVIVVEDAGSTARDYCTRLQGTTTLDVVYYSAPRKGRCFTGNVGLALARGEYIGFLDDDDLLFADHVETLVINLTDAKARIGYAYAWEVETSFTPENWTPYREEAPISRLNRPFDRVALWAANYLPIQAVLFHRSLYERFGGFAEELDNLEDWDLWQRYALAGDFLTVPKTTSLFRMPAGSAARIKRMRTLHEHYSAAAARQDLMPWGGTVGEMRRATDRNQVARNYRRAEKIARYPRLFAVLRFVKRMLRRG